MSNPAPTIEPRKRPRQARSAATVDAIVEAATRILKVEGLAGLNTNAVARLAGVSVGSLYQYFPTKEAILTEMLRRKRTRLLADLEAVLEGMEHRGQEEITARLVAASLKNQARTPKLAQALDYASSALPLHEEMMETNRRIVAALTRFLTFYGTPNPEEAAQDITGLVRGMMLQSLRGGTVDDEALAGRICHAINGYLRELRRHAGGPEEAARAAAE